MHDISCDMCRDLLPLVQDGVASEDSCRAVKAHLAGCEACRSLCRGELPPVPDVQGAWKKFRRRWQLTWALLLMFGIFFGLSLTATSELLYNALIMPIIGILGYVLFRKKAFYLVPLLLLVTHFALYLLSLLRGVQHLDLFSLLMWTVFYSFFALLGSTAAWLLHFAFGKE